MQQRRRRRTFGGYEREEIGSQTVYRAGAVVGAAVIAASGQTRIGGLLPPDHSDLQAEERGKNWPLSSSSCSCPGLYCDDNNIEMEGGRRILSSRSSPVSTVTVVSAVDDDGGGGGSTEKTGDFRYEEGEDGVGGESTVDKGLVHSEGKGLGKERRVITATKYEVMFELPLKVRARVLEGREGMPGS